MSSFNFDKWNKIIGWSVFAVALISYWLTVEPTASFWDAGEYITTASNLEVISRVQDEENASPLL